MMAGSVKTTRHAYVMAPAIPDIASVSVIWTGHSTGLSGRNDHAGARAARMIQSVASTRADRASAAAGSVLPRVASNTASRAW
jgi:hypothetical protein